jgi:membrane associated rhomboid family serine protease
VLQPRERVVTFVTFLLILVWFGLQFASAVAVLGSHVQGGVAYWAHIGGFVAGLALAAVLRRKPPTPSPHDRYFRRLDADWRA